MLDAALRGFVEAPDEAEAERRLGALMEEQAAPLVRAIVARKLGAGGRPASSDQDDIVGDALLALVQRLQSLRADREAEPIESFTDYAAVVAHNAFAHYLRRRHPERSRLKHRLRYVLTHGRGFGLWPHADGLTCGLAAWRPNGPSRDATDTLQRVIAEPERWLAWTRKGPADDPAGLAGAIFQAIGGPVEFDGLVAAVAAVMPAGKASAADAGVRAAEVSPPPDLALDQRRLTRRLWDEVALLPLRQRVALLLSLRDARGASLLWVFPLTGTATIRQIAAVLEMPDMDLAELWNRLPLDDLAIAARLACARQQVINLRGAARKRLANRLHDPGGGARAAAPANIRAVSTSLEDKA